MSSSFVRRRTCPDTTLRVVHVESRRYDATPPGIVELLSAGGHGGDTFDELDDGNLSSRVEYTDDHDVLDEDVLGLTTPSAP